MNVRSYTGYQAYIASPEWQAVREEALRRVGYRCQGCSSDERLEVHHLTYERLGHERQEDLMVLCHLCHAREHGRSPSVGPIAGPNPLELTRKVRDRERLERHQSGVLFAAWIAEYLASFSQQCKEIRDTDVLTRRSHSRVRLIEKELVKLIKEVSGDEIAA